jgi:hypothetical protein
MGAALGLIFGAGLGMLGGYERQQREQKQKQTEAADQFIMQSGEKDPAGFAHYLSATPEGQKWGKRHFGEGLEMATGLAQARAVHVQKQAADFQNLVGGEQPSSQPMTGASPTPGQGQPAAGTSPSPAASPQGQPQPSPIKHPQTLEEWQAFHDKLISGRAEFADNPAMLKALDDHIASAEKAMEQLRTQQGQTQRQQTGFQNQETLRKERLGDEEKLLGERGAQEKGLIGARESASLDEARQKKKEGLTGSGDKPAKPVDPMVAANRAGVVLSKLQKQADKEFADKEPGFWNRAGHRQWQADKEAWLAKQATTAGVNPDTGLPLSLSPVETPSDVDGFVKKYGGK